VGFDTTSLKEARMNNVLKELHLDRVALGSAHA
jgi:hypothetical protein